MGFWRVEATDEVVTDPHHGIGIRGVDEVGVVVMPLKSFLSLEWFSNEEWEMILTIQFKVGREVCVGDETERVSSSTL